MNEELRQKILAYLRRTPSAWTKRTTDAIASALRLPREQVGGELQAMLDDKIVVRRTVGTVSTRREPGQRANEVQCWWDLPPREKLEGFLESKRRAEERRGRWIGEQRSDG